MCPILRLSILRLSIFYFNHFSISVLEIDHFTFDAFYGSTILQFGHFNLQPLYDSTMCQNFFFPIKEDTEKQIFTITHEKQTEKYKRCWSFHLIQDWTTSPPCHFDADML